MTKLETLSLVIPCYNEEEGIPYLQSQLTPVLADLEKRWQLELLFIDDGSTDRTNELLQQAFSSKPYMKIVRHETNRNLGAALRTGFVHATGNVIVTIDSDCTYRPQEITALLSLLDKETAMVTASPYHPLGGVKNVPRYRLFLSKSITKIYQLLTGADIHTFTALFRAQRKELVKNISFESNDFLATAELLIYALFKGYKVKEYPTVLHVRQFGSSKMKLLKVIWSHTKFAVKMAKERVRR